MRLKNKHLDIMGIVMILVEAVRMYKLSKKMKRKINIIGQRLRLREKRNQQWKDGKHWVKKPRKREFKGRKPQKQT